MEFLKFIRSVEELLYEMTWLLFYPRTLWRCVVHSSSNAFLRRRSSSASRLPLRLAEWVIPSFRGCSQFQPSPGISLSRPDGSVGACRFTALALSTFAVAVLVDVAIAFVIVGLGA
ncbi:hypothetical protein [Variovorax sp. OV329]|uniref:hypothetical protein n=1 Tax=Variovorax sp. OV329 TaxID=1882825 RepID=UPI0008E1AE08|nr:hypothetical protein [Variovorax sp. OV329]SFN34385.1 hypothetical protein SAMN05444747_12261 [Variovorax sp. OV329]